jgi:predicted TIM-barrel fold metal-dependent hydrolase
MLTDSVWPVSVNDHIIETPDAWTSRVAAKYRAAAPHLVEQDGGAQAWRFGDEMVPLGFILASPLVRADAARPVRRFEDVHLAAWSAAARLAVMDREKVAVHTLMPQVCGFAGERLRRLGDPALWAACVSAYNDFLLDEVCAVAPERLVGIALLPLADPAAMVAEIARVAARGARGIALPHDPAPAGLPSYHDPSWMRVFDAADDAGLPPFIHIGSNGRGWAPAGDPLWKPVPVMVTLANLDVMIAASDLAFSPLLIERPQRRVIFLEGNLSWAPYLEERADFAVNGNRAGQAVPSARKPSQIIHDQVMASFLRDPLAIALRHQIGLDRFLWQDDFPHSDSLYPDSRAALAALLRDVPDGEARQIAEGNARKLLRLPPSWTPPA